MYENKYNGWSNYSTWRINENIFNNIQWNENELTMLSPEMLKNHVEDIVFKHSSSGLMEDYARAFLFNVNYKEIFERHPYWNTFY